MAPIKWPSLLMYCVGTMVSAIPMPKLPGLYTPDLCLPMTDHSYPGDPDGDILEERIKGFWQDTLYCKLSCCGDSKTSECCVHDEEEGLGTFQLVSIVAAGIAGVTIVTIMSTYLIKKHTKQKRLVRDIADINRMNNKKHVTKGKVGQYEKAPKVKKSKKEGKLFQDTKNRPKTPIAILAAPEILPDLKGVTKATFIVPQVDQLNYTNPANQKIDPSQLISGLKAPSPPASTTFSPLSPSPPIPEHLPPPLILPPLRTAMVDDEFLDSLLATLELDDSKSKTPSAPKF